MADLACAQAMEALNDLLASGALQADAALVARLQAGEHPADILADIGNQHTTQEQTQNLTEVFRGWPDDHVELATRAVGWGLGKAAAGEDIRIVVNGDNQSPNTITRITFEGNELRIDFEHPPA